MPRPPVFLPVVLLSLLIPLALPAGATRKQTEREKEREKEKPVPGQPAAPRELEGETDNAGWMLPRLPVPDSALHHPDPAIAGLAGRIADGSADLRDRRAWYMLSLNYAPFTGLPPEGWRQRALADGAALTPEAQRRAAAVAGARPAPAPALASYGWTSLGPTSYNVGGSDMAQGRLSTLWVHPTNVNFILAGFAGGGVWKTTNGGGAWTPLTDFQATTSIGSLDVLVRTDTTNLTDAILYVGTGEGNTSGDAIDGAGVLKSLDGGATWALQTLPWTLPSGGTSTRWRHQIRKIVIDRNVAGGQSVWAAGDGGVYRTVDGGANWTLVSALPYTNKPVTGGCWPELATDLVIDSGVNPSRIYVAFGARSNSSAVAALSCTGVANDVNFRRNNGIYRSLDGGGSWAQLTGGGFPASPGQLGRITLVSAPSDRRQMYALISCVTNGATTCTGGQYSSLGIYRTTDITAGSVAWTLGSTTNFTSAQGWYNLTGSVDPTNPAKLLVGGLDAYISTNSAGTLTAVSSWTGSGTNFVHADHHATLYYNATTVFEGCDGGLFKGTVSGSSVSWTHLNAGGLSTLQFYGIGQHPVTANRIHGGLQDNGEAYSAAAPGGWSETAGGDGGFSATDQSNGNNAYEEYVYGGISRSTSGGAGGWTCIQNFGGVSGCGQNVPDGQCAFIAPVVLDYNNQSILYSGCKFVYRNSNAPASATWAAISPDLVGTTYDYITQVHSARNNGVAGTIWATTLNGRVWVTTNNGTNWTNTTAAPLPNNPTLPNRAATWITTHPQFGNRAIVTFSGWNGSGNQPGHVFRTVDGGATWTDITGTIPDEPAFTVVADPNRPNDVYVGTEYGIYLNANAWAGSNWTRVNGGQLPHVHIHQLEFSRANNKLRAATHGRGIWELTVTRPAAKPVPDGLFIPGVPLKASKGTGNAVVVNYDQATCSAGGANAYWGDLTPAALAGYTYSGEECALPQGGSINSIPAATSAFFIVAGTDGGVNESGDTQDSAGVWHGSGVGRCGVTTQSTAATCP